MFPFSKATHSSGRLLIEKQNKSLLKKLYKIIDSNDSNISSLDYHIKKALGVYYDKIIEIENLNNKINEDDDFSDTPTPNYHNPICNVNEYIIKTDKIINCFKKLFFPLSQKNMPINDLVYDFLINLSRANEKICSELNDLRNNIFQNILLIYPSFSTPRLTDEVWEVKDFYFPTVLLKSKIKKTFLNVISAFEKLESTEEKNLGITATNFINKYSSDSAKEEFRIFICIENIKSVEFINTGSEIIAKFPKKYLDELKDCFKWGISLGISNDNVIILKNNEIEKEIKNNKTFFLINTDKLKDLIKEYKNILDNSKSPYYQECKNLINPILFNSLFLLFGDIIFTFSNIYESEHNHIQRYENSSVQTSIFDDESDLAKVSNSVSIQGVGGLFVIIDREIQSKDKYVGAIFNNFENLSDILATRIISNLLFYNERENSLLFKISKIINRNYAHHIGSHVSHRATLDKVLERIHKGIDTDNTEKYLINCGNELNTTINMLNILDKYKNERNDFIAGLEVKMQPFSAWFFADIMHPFLKNTLLLDNIAASEGICYTINSYEDAKSIDEKNINRLKFKVLFNNKEVYAKYDNDSNKTSRTLAYYNEVAIESNESNLNFYKELKTINDFKVCIPGSLGKHAFYSIFENIIRNSAKHNIKELGERKELEITLDFISTGNENRYYELKIYDNITKNKKSVLQPALKEDLSIDQKLGIGDIRINAVLLKGEELNEKTLKESVEIDEFENGTVFYKINILKPNSIYYLTELRLDENQSKLFEESGILVRNDLNDLYNNNFEMLLIFHNNLEGDQLIKKLNENIDKLPFRIIFFNKNIEYPEVKIPGLNNKRIVETKDPELEDIETKIKMLKNEEQIKDIINELTDFCWKNWVGCKWGYNNYVHIGFDQTRTESPTKEFSIYGEKFKLSDSKLFVYESGIDAIGNNFFNCINPPEQNDRTADKKVTHIFYDRHGKILNSEYTKKNVNLNIVKSDSYILFDKNSKDFDILYNTDFNSDNTIIYRLIEAGLLKVLIIDERFFEIYDKKAGEDYNKLKEKRMWNYELDNAHTSWFDACWASNVYLATKLSINGEKITFSVNKEPCNLKNHFLEIQFNLNNQIYKDKNIVYKSNYLDHLESQTNYTPDNTIDNDGNCIKEWKITIPSNENSKEEKKKKLNTLGKHFKEGSPVDLNIDVLVIHRRLLKDILKVEKNFVDEVRNFIPKILITTGGGTIEEFRKYNLNKIEFSNLKDLVFPTRVSKYLLTKTILNL